MGLPEGANLDDIVAKIDLRRFKRFKGHPVRFKGHPHFRRFKDDLKDTHILGGSVF